MNIANAYTLALTRIKELEAERDRLREDLLSIQDRLHNGIEYDEKLNIYVVVWTKREIEQAKAEADEIWKRLGFKEETT